MTTIDPHDEKTLQLSPGGSLLIGLSWDPVPIRGELLAKFGKAKTPTLDLDASVIAFDRHGLQLDTVWLRKLRGLEGAIRHSGDNQDGAAEGDDERIVIDLGKLPEETGHLALTISSFNGQDFASVKRARLSVREMASREIIWQTALEGQGRHTGLVMAVIARSGEGWVLRPASRPIIGRSILGVIEAAGRAV